MVAMISPDWLLLKIRALNMCCKAPGDPRKGCANQQGKNANTGAEEKENQKKLHGEAL